MVPSCPEIKSCETLTNLSPFKLDNNSICVVYTGEDNIQVERCFDFSLLINGLLDSVDPKCVTTATAWNNMTFQEKIQAIIDAHCGNPSTTTTTTEAPITTTQAPIISACISYKLTNPTAGILHYTYMACGDVTATTLVLNPNSIVSVCAVAGSVDVDSGIIVEEIAACAAPTTTTTTTIADPFDYYFANKRSCISCGTIDTANVLVKFPTGTGVILGNFYTVNNPNDGFVYEVLSTAPSGPAVDLTHAWMNTACSTACSGTAPTTTTTTTLAPAPSTTTTTTLAPTTTTTTTLPPTTTTTTTLAPTTAFLTNTSPVTLTDVIWGGTDLGAMPNGAGYNVSKTATSVQISATGQASFTLTYKDGANVVLGSDTVNVNVSSLISIPAGTVAIGIS